MNTYKCPKCETEFSLGTKFCNNCGCNLEVEFIETPICPKCRKTFPGGTIFCSEDGIRLVSPEQIIPKKRVGKKYGIIIGCMAIIALVMVLMIRGNGIGIGRSGQNIAINDVHSIHEQVAAISTSLDGVVINGVRWATRNVDAPGTFADAPESTGMFFQWNRRQGWTDTENLSNWRDDFQAEVWGRANNPCPPGWRVPTALEFHSLDASNSVWATRNGVPGRLFGTAPNQIFLPATGAWDWDWQDGNNMNWTFQHVGTRGSYWGGTHIQFYDSFGPGGLLFSNEPMPFETGGGYAGSYVYFINTPSPMNVRSVRCVSDATTQASSIRIMNDGARTEAITITLPVSGATQLHTTVEPVWTTNTNVTWASSNPNVATVEYHRNWNWTWSAGIVGVSTGTAIITATATDGSGVSSSVTVTVENVNISNSLDGVIINGIRWATRNVDAPGTFATTPESAGMLFQWNRRRGWSATGRNVSGWDVSVPIGTSWYAINDPCPTGWRIPTQNELQSLADAGGIPMMHNGVGGHLFGFGTPNQIFLPNVGRRRAGWHDGTGWRESGELWADGGVYWSSTQGDSESALSFSHNWITWDQRASGNSVRCVAK